MPDIEDEPPVEGDGVDDSSSLPEEVFGNNGNFMRSLKQVYGRFLLSTHVG